MFLNSMPNDDPSCHCLCTSLAWQWNLYSVSIYLICLPFRLNLVIMFLVFSYNVCIKRKIKNKTSSKPKQSTRSVIGTCTTDGSHEKHAYHALMLPIYFKPFLSLWSFCFDNKTIHFIANCPVIDKKGRNHKALSLGQKKWKSSKRPILWKVEASPFESVLHKICLFSGLYVFGVHWAKTIENLLICI